MQEDSTAWSSEIVQSGGTQDIPNEFSCCRIFLHGTTLRQRLGTVPKKEDGRWLGQKMLKINRISQLRTINYKQHVKASNRIDGIFTYLDG